MNILCIWPELQVVINLLHQPVSHKEK